MADLAIYSMVALAAVVVFCWLERRRVRAVSQQRVVPMDRSTRGGRGSTRSAPATPRDPCIGRDQITPQDRRSIVRGKGDAA